MRNFITGIFLSLLCTLVFAQEEQLDSRSFDEIFQEAIHMLDAENYSGAYKDFSYLIEQDTANANLKFQAGICCLSIPKYKNLSIEYLAKAAENISLNSEPDSPEEVFAPVEALYWLGSAYHKNFRFNEAISVLNKLIEEYVSNDDDEFMKIIHKLINECETAKLMVMDPVDMEVSYLGDSVNTEYSEHSPVVSADESILIFTSKRAESTGGLMTEDGQYFEDIYISEKIDNKWSSPKQISPEVNSAGHEASIGLSADGQQLLIYKDDNGDGNIYISKLDGDRWTTPKSLGKTVNTKYQEKHASFSADGKAIYFSSDRKDGFGGFDIYVVKKLPNGEWSEAQNLGKDINTEYNEEGPFMHPDGVTLFFSSQGHSTMGGYDIFFSTRIENETSWEEPTNIGFPINSPEDDVFYLPTVDGKRAYYSTCQAEGAGSYDLYMISVPGVEAKPLTIYTGLVLLHTGKPPKEGYITVTDNTTSREVGMYTPNSKTGKYLFVLPTEKSFTINYYAENDLSYEMDLSVNKESSYDKLKRAVHLPPIILGGESGNYMVHFEDGKYELNEAADITLGDLSDLLKNDLTIFAKLVADNNPLLEDLIRKRESVITQKLAENGIAENRIISSFSDEPNENKVDLIMYGNDLNTIAEAKKKAEEQSASDVNELLSQINEDQTGNKHFKISDILFDVDKYKTDKYNQILDTLIFFMKNNPEMSIRIVGHTDATASDEYNQKLSEKRAGFVKDYLVTGGVFEKNITTEGAGEKIHIAVNDSEIARKYNRRVEIFVVKDGGIGVTVERTLVPDEFKINRTD